MEQENQRQINIFFSCVGCITASELFCSFIWCCLHCVFLEEKDHTKLPKMAYQPIHLSYRTVLAHSQNKNNTCYYIINPQACTKSYFLPSSRSSLRTHLERFVSFFQNFKIIGQFGLKRIPGSHQIHWKEVNLSLSIHFLSSIFKDGDSESFVDNVVQYLTTFLL